MPRLQATTRPPVRPRSSAAPTEQAGTFQLAEVPVLSIRVELRHIVADEQIGAVDGGRRHVEVEVDRQEQPGSGAEPFACERRDGVLDDRARGDDDLGAVDRLPRRVRDEHVAPEFEHPLRHRVEGDELHVGAEVAEHPGVVAALLAAAQDRRATPALRCPGPDTYPARGGGARGGDLRRIEDRDREPRVGVVDDDHAGDEREAACRIVREARDPLERDGVGFTEIRRHRVHEGIGAGMHADLRRHLDGAACKRAIRRLDEVDLLVERRQQPAYLIALDRRWEERSLRGSRHDSDPNLYDSTMTR